VAAAIAVAQSRDGFGIDREWNVFRLVDGEQIRNDGNGDPVIALDVVIAADDDSLFSGLTAPQQDGRSRTDPRR